MADFNPYQAPVEDAIGARPPVDTDQPPLATRGQRFAAAMIDALIVGGINLVLLMGVFDVDLERSGQDLGSLVTYGVLGLITTAAVQWHFLHRGQTVGKRLIGLRMVDFTSNRPLTAGRVFWLRFVPVSVASMVPFIGGLLTMIDALYIFGGERRCLHDLIAGTKVVLASHSVAEPAPR